MIRRFAFGPLALVLLSFLLAACASEAPVLPPEKPVEELYNSAMDLMDSKEYTKAARAFEEVDRQHPYSVWSSRAQLMAGYALYQAMNYDDAIVALDQYIRFHPGGESIAYANYLRALCDYERLADVRRDQGYALSSLQQLQSIVSRFPETTYAKDAVLKIALVNDHLAGSEMEVGRNYLKQKIYPAAINRFRTVIEKYQTTSHVPEALHRLVESYLAIGITSEAKATAAVLGHNFPGSPWYQDSFDLLTRKNLAPEDGDKNSWIARTWKDLF